MKIHKVKKLKKRLVSLERKSRYPLCAGLGGESLETDWRGGESPGLTYQSMVEPGNDMFHPTAHGLGLVCEWVSESVVRPELFAELEASILPIPWPLVNIITYGRKFVLLGMDVPMPSGRVCGYST